MSRRGGLLVHGDADQLGTIPTLGLCKPKPAADLLPSSTGNGYGIVQTDGNVLEFGDASALGNASGEIVDAATV
jgi:hypothetical protein